MTINHDLVLANHNLTLTFPRRNWPEEMHAARTGLGVVRRNWPEILVNEPDGMWSPQEEEVRLISHELAVAQSSGDDSLCVTSSFLRLDPEKSKGIIDVLLGCHKDRTLDCNKDPGECACADPFIQRFFPEAAGRPDLEDSLTESPHAIIVFSHRTGSLAVPATAFLPLGEESISFGLDAKSEMIEYCLKMGWPIGRARSCTTRPPQKTAN